MGLKYSHGLTYVYSIVDEYYMVTSDVQAQIVSDRDMYIVKALSSDSPPSKEFLPTLIPANTFFVITTDYVYYVKISDRGEATLTMYKDV